MVGNLLERSRRTNTAGLVLIACCGLTAAYASVALSGTKTGAALAAIATIGPALLYAAITAPVAFPFSLYTLLTPFDSVLDLPATGTITRLLGIAAAAALLFYMLRTKRFIEPPREVTPMLLLYLWMAASMFWAIDVPSSQALLPTAVQLFGLYLIVSMMPMRVSGLRQVVAAAAIGGIASAVYGLYMYHTGAGIFKNRLFIHTDTSALNPDHFAASLVLPIALCIVALFWSRSLWVKAVCIAGLGAMLSTVALTGSRGAFLGLGALFAYLLVRDRHRWSLAAVGAGMTALAAIVAGPAMLAQRWQLAAQNGGAGRVSIWDVGWIAFKQNWLFGAGYANFPFAYDRAFMQTFQSFYANWHRASHNILLGTAVELGVIGLILLVLAWWGQFSLLRTIDAQDVRWPVRLALESALIGLFVCGLFADIMIEKYLWLAFMLVVMARNTAPVETTANA